MKRSRTTALPLAIALLALPFFACSTQKTDEGQVAEQAPPPADEAQSEPAPPPPPPTHRATTTERKSAPRHTETIPEERPRRMATEPPPPQTVEVAIPAGTSLSLTLSQPLSSENAMPGDAVTATLKNPIVVGDRVAFPAGSRVEGRVTDVKSAKKGFKDTGGALAVSLTRIVAPDGRSAAISAAFTKVAEGSGKKKGAIIGGSAAGAAVLGKMLGKNAGGAAILGGAIGAAVAGATKGKEATLSPDEEITVALEGAARTMMKR